MDNTYILSMKAHISEMESDLKGLSDILSERPHSRPEALTGTLYTPPSSCGERSEDRRIHSDIESGSLSPAKGRYSLAQLSSLRETQQRSNPVRPCIYHRH